jgi:DNA-binding winged helix-turn-helix (wHTH) protein
MKRFHGFRLDTTNQCLWRGDERMSLAPKAFDLLRYLVDHADRLVTHQEILDALWIDTFVNPEVVKKYILGIRKVLGDQHDTPAFIRTVPKRGYQFVAPITEEPSRRSGGAGPTTKPLLDRPAARARLEECLERATRGERQFVFITGEPGVGKTTFVDQFMQSAGHRPDLWIARGQCVEGFGGQEAYYPLLTALEQLVHGSDGRRVVHALATRAPTWLMQFPSLVPAEQRDALQRETFGATRERMVREMCDTLEAMTADRTLIVVLEDLHWADLSTLDVISSGARRNGRSRLLVIGTRRSPAGAAAPTALQRLLQDLAIRQLCLEIGLASFEPAEVSEYLSLAFGRPRFADDLAAVIHRHSAGNPLFMTALVADLLTTGAVARDGATWRLTVDVDRIQPAVPATLREMLNVQFDQLTPDEQRVLRRASAIGERFAAWTIADGAADLDAIERICESLAERRLFMRGAGMGELADGTMAGFYQFHHALYRQAVYRRLSDVMRAKVHRAVGERLETLFGPQTLALASELAVHFEHAHDYERAIDYGMRAARNADRRFAVREAIELLQHALALVPRLPVDRRTAHEIELLGAIGDEQYVRGAMVESAHAYETGAAVAMRAGLTSAQVRLQSCFARPLGLLDPDRALVVVQEAATASVTLEDRVLRARIELFAACARLLYDTWRTEDVQVCDATYPIVRDDHDPTTPGFARMFYAHVQSLQGDCLAALQNAETGLPRQHEPDDLMMHFFALSAQILALLQLGRFGEALQIIRSSQQMAERNGTDTWLFSYREAWLRMLVMDFQGARRVCEGLSRSSVYPTGQALAIGRLAIGYEALDAGRWEEARQHCELVRDPRQTPKFFLHWYWKLHAQIGVVRAWLHAGQLAHARLEGDRLIDAVARVGDPNLHALAWDARAQVAMAESHWTEASQYLDRAFAALARFGLPMVAWRVYATAAAIARQLGESDAAAIHDERARAHLAALVDSFPPEEPLRAVMLAATRHAGVARTRSPK